MSGVDYAERARQLYDGLLADGERVRELVFPRVFGSDEWIGQYSDNTVADLRLLVKRAEITADSLVLDIGCGSAGPAVFIAREVGCRVVGIDVSAGHVEAARHRVRVAALEHQVQVLHGDIFAVSSSLPKADVAIGLGAWCHFDVSRLFSHCAGLLRPGGRLAFMERVRLGVLDGPLLRQLTEDWASPSVETFASYWRALRLAGFDRILIDDMSDRYCLLQERFVRVREELREELIRVMGRVAYEEDLRLVRAEQSAAAARVLGYGMFVAERA